MKNFLIKSDKKLLAKCVNNVNIINTRLVQMAVLFTHAISQKK